MLELGDEAVEAHREVGRTAAEYGVGLVVAVGDGLAKQLALTAGAAGVRPTSRWSVTTAPPPLTWLPSSARVTSFW
ncbi:hypothetical protein [Streptomyces luteogriseus]|uniref:hypothetical protein n=1 Tax=Streptomyces luteogriseus TaxID=68233 RepID=UPI003825BC07